LKPDDTREIAERIGVLEKNPPKQGLKPPSGVEFMKREQVVLEKNPPKQGLKQYC